jgi:Rrf2 family nitric oxide-sensitive transcriptional repressor
VYAEYIFRRRRVNVFSMRLTLFSDYALRILLYLAAHPGRLVRVAEVSEAYGVSENHLVKVVQLLVARGLVESVRGRGGGLQLACPPESIKVGAVLRATEPDLDLVECFDPTSSACPITPACGLKHALEEAQGAFLARLDAYTLSDFLPQRAKLLKLWRR